MAKETNRFSSFRTNTVWYVKRLLFIIKSEMVFMHFSNFFHQLDEMFEYIKMASL
jgi:hypothetical protein